MAIQTNQIEITVKTVMDGIYLSRIFMSSWVVPVAPPLALKVQEGVRMTSILLDVVISTMASHICRMHMGSSALSKAMPS